jgi:Domain of unknown function (DUF4386)
MAMTSTRQLSRIAGGLYLVLAVCGAFAEVLVRSSVYVPGHAAATAEEISASETLFRFGALADLVGITCFMVLGLILWRLLRPVGLNAATAMLVFIAVSVALTTANMTNHLGALNAATAGDDAAAMRFLEAHHDGYLVAGILFGLWLLPLGFLLVRSGAAPKWLGILAMVGPVGYVIDVAANVLFGTPGEPITEVFLLPAVIAELSLVVWLLVKGLDLPEPVASLPAPPAERVTVAV